MTRPRALPWMLAGLLAAAPAAAALMPAELAGVGAAPPAGAVLPVGLAFADQAGRPYRLAPARVPTVLLFADYTCRNVCGPGITLTAGALHDAGLRPGVDYRMLVIGLDRDGPAAARAMAAARLRALPAEAQAMALLTGDADTVARAERALGYHAVFDAEADQFAHDAAVYVFAPGGALSALLPETATTPAALRRAIADARAGRPLAPAPRPRADDGLAGRITALCYGLAAAHGVYARPIVLALRLGGVAICAAIGAVLVLGWRRERRA